MDDWMTISSLLIAWLRVHRDVLLLAAAIVVMLVVGVMVWRRGKRVSSTAIGRQERRTAFSPADRGAALAASLKQALRSRRMRDATQAGLGRVGGWGTMRGWLARRNGERTLPTYLVVGACDVSKAALLRSLRPTVSGDGIDDGTEAAPLATGVRWHAARSALIADAATSGPASHQTWITLLELLRRRRPAFPFNGIVIPVDAGVPLAMHGSDLAVHMRGLLDAARERCRASVPIYVVVTGIEALVGFADHAATLTDTERAAPLGGKLPWNPTSTCAGVPRREEHENATAAWHAVLGHAADDVEQRLNARLQAADGLARKRIYAFSEEFRGLCERTAHWLDMLFASPALGPPDRGASLRGVYFVSVTPPSRTTIVDPQTLFNRVARLSVAGGFEGENAVDWAGSPVDGPGDDVNDVDEINDGQCGPAAQSCFAASLFPHLILRDAALGAGPALRRARRRRIGAHLAITAASACLATTMLAGAASSRHYLQRVASAIDNQGGIASDAMRSQATEIPADGLSTGRALSLAAAVVPSVWPEGWSGKWSEKWPGETPYLGAVRRAVVERLDAAWRRVLDRWWLPRVERRLAEVLRETTASGHAQRLFDTLGAYLMLHDGARFDAAVLRAWTRAEMASPPGRPGAAAEVPLGPEAKQDLNGALDALFDGSRIVRAHERFDAGRVAAARNQLGARTPVERLYERAKAAMAGRVPPDFTLGKLLGSRAVALARRTGNSAFDAGVPGLFTHDGYHSVFLPGLGALVARAHAADRWVLGDGPDPVGAHGTGTPVLPMEAARKAAPSTDVAALVEDVHRRYLAEYAMRWEALIEDLVPADTHSLAEAANLLAQLAGESAVMPVLGEALARHTTLATPQVSAPRELVDARFAALREALHGRPGAADPTGPAAGTPGKPTLAGAMALAEVYGATLRGIGNGQPTAAAPALTEAAARLRAESLRLPPPFRALLGGALAQTARELNKGVGLRLADQMETTIGERCRLAIEGRYPFTAASGQDMALDDFARIFAVGGLLDDFFQRTLSPHVDTSGAVWRYRMPADDVPQVPGPSLAPFQRARQIREAFFRGPDPGTMGWRVDVKVTALDPEIVELNLDFDGQSQRYVHGPVVPLRVAWPGPAGRLGATLAASPPGQAKSPPLSASGAWALMRVIAKGKLVNSINQGHFQAEYDFDGRKATLDISTGAAPNPWTTGLLQGFRCPARGR